MIGNRKVIIHSSNGSASMGNSVEEQKARVTMDYHEITARKSPRAANDNKGPKASSIKKILMIMIPTLIVLGLIMVL